jgi:3-methyladenine DNA glycosylase AlkD
LSDQLKAIQKVLTAKAAKTNAEFFLKMVPRQQKIYGVKTPDLNLLAKQYKTYSFTLAEELWKSGALEEKIIAIKMIEKTGKTDPAKLLRVFKRFSESIDNWAICDGLGMQFLRGIVKTHASEIFELATKLNGSRDPWQRRLSLVMVEWYTRDKQFHPQIRKLMKELENDDEYYVKKAVAWINKNFAKGK